MFLNRVSQVRFLPGALFCVVPADHSWLVSALWDDTWTDMNVKVGEAIVAPSVEALQ
jgi:hypothetical protein